MTVQQRLTRLGLALPRLLVPRADIDLSKWAIIACDQFNNDLNYWQEIERFVDNAPSSLHYIIPEIYLETGGDEVRQRVTRSQERMTSDIADGTLREVHDEEGTDGTAVWVRRNFTDGSSRDGLLFSLDLTRYHYQREAGTMIQATEETFAERIEPRRAIRERAALELPHILVFYNDPAHTVRTALLDAASALPPSLLYQAELMGGGGELRGTQLPRSALTAVIDAFERLHTVHDGGSDSTATATTGGGGGALFFVGDGNHSLAAAREHWQELARHGAPADHPARHALVELINIHDRGLKFEPIHKYLATETPAAAEELWKRLAKMVGSQPQPQSSSSAAADSTHAICFHGGGQAHTRTLGGRTLGGRTLGGRTLGGRTLHHSPPSSLPADVELQRLLARVSADLAASDNVSAPASPPSAPTLLFAHDRAELMQLAATRNGIAVEMPPLDRGAILDYIATVGVLPKKSFSLGKPEEKRYYMECRRIIPRHP